MNQSVTTLFIRLVRVCSAALPCAALIVADVQVASGAGTVGMGTADSCTEAALDAALVDGGLVTFDCGPEPVTITLTHENEISSDTAVDGGGLITLDGNRAVRAFAVSQGRALAVENLAIVNCEASNGGGAIFNDGGLLTVMNSSFFSNANVAPSNSFGGAIYSNDGSLSATSSSFSGNSAGSGGAIDATGGSLSVTNCIFSANNAFQGGAITAKGSIVTVTNSTFADNKAARPSAVLPRIGIVGTDLIEPRFISIDLSTGGAIVSGDNGVLTVTNSTFSGNSAHRGGAVSNGFFNSTGGTLTVTNSTFAGNGGGGAIVTTASADTFSTVTNSTFAGNSGGAINNYSGYVRLVNCILANSTGDNCNGAFINGGHNLDDGMSCGFWRNNYSLSNTDPQLDPAGLQDNGGPTQTIALESGSPAINGGDAYACKKAPIDNRDQRGFVRPGSGHTDCSIGAYEADVNTAECVGDCDAGGSVTVDELVTLVNIALGAAQPSMCANGVPSDAAVDVAVVVHAVKSSLNGCGGG